MNDHDTDDLAVLDALRASMDGATMGTPLEQIVAVGQARRRRARIVTVAAVALVAGGVALGVTTYANPASAPPGSHEALHIQTVAYTVDRAAGGVVTVTWDKQRFIDDRAGLEAALRGAGFPVVIRVGEFCAGAGDDTTLSPDGSGPGVGAVVQSDRAGDGRVSFTFDPSKVPAGKQLFIGYLNDAQLAVTNGAPGAVERLVTASGPLTCTTVAPPPNATRKHEGTPPVVKRSPPAR